MSVSYDTFTAAFLSKVTEFDLLAMSSADRTAIVDKCMKKAIVSFKHVCLYDLTTTADDTNRVFNVNISDKDIDEIVDIVSEGMVVQWLKPYLYKQQLLSNVLNTRDFTVYSPAELLKRVGDTYAKAQNDYRQMIREYSFNHGEIESYHI